MTERWHGVIPADLDRRLHEQELDLPTRHLAKVLARELDRRPPLGAASRLRGDLCEAWGSETVERALVALHRAGYRASVSAQAAASARARRAAGGA
jgi:hypothetical protein